MKNLAILLLSTFAVLLVLSSFTYFKSTPEKQENQVKVTVLYGHPDDPAAFEAYYDSTHRSKAEKIKGIGRMELTKFAAGTDGRDPVFYRMAELYFPDVESMQETLNSPEGQAALADTENFATGGTTVVVGTVTDFEFKAD